MSSSVSSSSAVKHVSFQKELIDAPSKIQKKRKFEQEEVIQTGSFSLRVVDIKAPPIQFFVKRNRVPVVQDVTEMSEDELLKSALKSLQAMRTNDSLFSIEGQSSSYPKEDSNTYTESVTAFPLLIITPDEISSVETLVSEPFSDEEVFASVDALSEADKEKLNLRILFSLLHAKEFDFIIEMYHQADLSKETEFFQKNVKAKVSAALFGKSRHQEVVQLGSACTPSSLLDDIDLEIFVWMNFSHVRLHQFGRVIQNYERFSSEIDRVSNKELSLMPLVISLFQSQEYQKCLDVVNGLDVSSPEKAAFRPFYEKKKKDLEDLLALTAAKSITQNV